VGHGGHHRARLADSVVEKLHDAIGDSELDRLAQSCMSLAPNRSGWGNTMEVVWGMMTDDKATLPGALPARPVSWMYETISYG